MLKPRKRLRKSRINLPKVNLVYNTPSNIQRFDAVFTQNKTYILTGPEKNKKIQLPLVDKWGLHGLWPRLVQKGQRKQPDRIPFTASTISHFESSWKPLAIMKTTFDFMNENWSKHGRIQPKVGPAEYFNVGHLVFSAFKFKEALEEAYEKISPDSKRIELDSETDCTWRVAPAGILCKELQKIYPNGLHLKVVDIQGIPHLFEIKVELDYDITSKNTTFLDSGAKFSNCHDEDWIRF